MNSYYFLLPIFIGFVSLLASIYLYRNKQNRVNFNAMELISQAITYNTGSITNFRFEIENAHKELKVCLSNSNKNELEKALIHLQEVIHNSLFKVFEINMEYMAKYFEGRAVKQPRIHLKFHHDGRVFSGYIKNPKYFSEYRPEENTGFYSIISQGRYFLLNNIPYAAQRGLYKNPRLNQQCVANYKKKAKVFIHSLLNKSFTDTDWLQCWSTNVIADGSHIKPPIESCYKSTLIVPIQLTNNSLSFSFKELFQIPESSGSILGFLCFDHIDENYFNNSVDIDIATIFAQLLSSFLVESLKYTTYSHAFIKAQEIISISTKNDKKHETS